MFSAIQVQNGDLKLLDQRLLPDQEVWITCKTHEDVATAIENMTVRGAPAIGCAAAFGLAIAASEAEHRDSTDFKSYIQKAAKRLSQTRPTAVNLFHALQKVESSAISQNYAKTAKECAWTIAHKIYSDDLKTCQRIGENGSRALQGKNLRIMTHCNAGGIATTGYGTALGVIQNLFDNRRLEKVYVNETRPWLQGARLTTWELLRSDIPCQLGTDSSAGILMQQNLIDAVIVGADRIAMNGDTANKIGTYSLAVLANFHKIPFYIAAPKSTFDSNIQDGQGIPIETRPPEEITHFKGTAIAPMDVPAYNPSFDITPHTLITAYITEKGNLAPDQISQTFNDEVLL
ncbi:MAG: S-methyl-5-thioribose-1-phosphate isomerase [Oligoflexales bacterium]